MRDNLDSYLGCFPALREQAEERERHADALAKFEALRGVADDGWLAFMDSLGRPFRPFLFFNNTGPRSFDGSEMPFTEAVGTRGTVVTFASSFRDASAWCPGLVADLRLLRCLPLRNCYYGSASCPVHPFLCEVKPTRKTLTGADVIRALKVRHFRGDHIADLGATRIA